MSRARDGRTRRSDAGRVAEPPGRLGRDDGGEVRAAVAATGVALDAEVRAEMEARLGHDFGRVRVHDDDRAARSARALGARAYTAGEHVVVDPAAAASADGGRRGLLAHELTHVIQQGGSHGGADLGISRGDDAAEREAKSVGASRWDAPATVRSRVAPQVQCDLVDPGRLEAVNKDLFPVTTGGGGSGGVTRKPWKDKDPVTGEKGTAAEVIAKAKKEVLDIVKKNPKSVEGTMDVNTTEADLDTDAVDADKRLRARWPQISTAFVAKEVTDAVSVMGPSLTSGADYLRAWLTNKLVGWTDVEDFEIKENDPRFIAMLDALLADADVGKHLKTMASRQGGFQRGDGKSREIFIHSAIPEESRRVSLVHELTHFHEHPKYREWVKTTTDERFFNEGFTEWLARRVPSVKGDKASTGYPDRVKAIDDKVAVNVPEDDIARAFFAGEVWRIETRSPIARREFAAASGIAEGAKKKDEEASSRSGPGLNEEVVAGAHYRFLNLGHDRSDPKPEHETYFAGVKTKHVDASATARVQFVGHASTPGSTSHNKALSLSRAEAFYAMARKSGVPDDKLVGEKPVEHFGETKPTLTESADDAQTRAFNRRVEMFVTGAAAAGTSK